MDKKGKMGVHILVNLYGCPKEVLEKKNKVKNLLIEIVEEAELDKRGGIFYQYKPVGVTGVVMVAESHISIHTWPEHKSVAADIFCCGGREKAERAYKILIKKFRPKKVIKKVILR